MPLEEPSAAVPTSISSPWTKPPTLPTTSARPRSPSVRTDTLSGWAETKDHRGGTRSPWGNKGCSWGNEGSRRGNEGLTWGNDVHTAADIVGAGANDVAVERSADGRILMSLHTVVSLRWGARPFVQSPSPSRSCLPRRRPRHDIIRRRRGPPQPPTIPQPIPGHVRDEAGAKCLTQRVVHFASGLVTVL